MGRNFRIHGIGGLVLGLGCLALLLRQVDLKQSWHALAQVNGRFIVLAVLAVGVSLPLRAWRWQLIFPSSTRPSLGACLTLLGIGNMANFLLPGRAGDLARCVFVNRTGSLNASSRTLATLAVEKVLDGLALAGMVLFSVWVLHPPHWVLDLLRVAILIFGGALILLVSLRYRTRILIDSVRRAFRWIHLSSLEQRFDQVLTSFADGLGAVASIWQMLTLFVLTTAIWLSEAALVLILARALGIALPLKMAAVASAILGLGFMIPAAPGGLGTYELFGTEAFKLAGVAASKALALTIVIHAWIFIAHVAVGGGFLAITGMSLTQVKALEDEPALTPAGVRSASGTSQ